MQQVVQHLLQDLAMQAQKSQDQIIIKRQKEYQRDQILRESWKQARREFFINRIRAVTTQARATPEQVLSIQELFIHQNCDLKMKMMINFNKLGTLQAHRNVIEQLQGQYNAMNQQHRRRQKECFRIRQIIQLKYSSLRVIRIQYQQKQHGVRYYSASAFELFKLVHENRFLIELTLKGVLVQGLVEFMKSLYQNQIIGNNQGENWLESFKPLKFLKIGINAQVLFQVHQKEQTLQFLKHFKYFVDLFSSVSDITVIVQLGLGFWDHLTDQGMILQEMVRCFLPIRQLNIQIEGPGSYCIPNDSAHIVRFLLFGGLARLREIASLSFKYINFSKQVGFRAFLAIQQILDDIFANGTITQLKLSFCGNFPLIRNATTLQSITIYEVSFRQQQFEQMRFIIQTNPNIRSIDCGQFHERWSFDDKLFNNLQTLTIHEFRYNIDSLDYISPQSLSNIKRLTICTRSVHFCENITALFPKLANLSYFYQHWLICMIPSPYLEELHFVFNNIITDQGIGQIDQKWPLLRSVTLGQCRSITEQLWNVCQFQGLMEVKINQRLLGKGRKALPLLKAKGIKVQYIG